jgi:hypothetical protein
MADISNELITKYDQRFNESYRKIIDINSSIMNKEELILQQNDEIQKKDNTITILNYSIYLIIIYGILLILKVLNKITGNILLISLIVLFIIYLILIYYSVYSTYNKVNIQGTIKNLKVTMDQYVYDITGDVQEYTCPTNCPQTSDSAPTTNMIQSKSTPILNIDRQLNVWKYGDVPSDGYTSDSIPGSTFYTNPNNIPNYDVTTEENSLNSPQSYFGTTYPTGTYYDCKWLGGNNGGLQNAEDDEKYSTIPCSFRENMEEVGRFYCKQDPNQKGAGSDNCQDMTNY